MKFHWTLHVPLVRKWEIAWGRGETLRPRREWIEPTTVGDYSGNCANVNVKGAINGYGFDSRQGRTFSPLPRVVFHFLTRANAQYEIHGSTLALSHNADPFLETPGNLPGPISIFLIFFSTITQWLETRYFANVFIDYTILKFSIRS